MLVFEYDRISNFCIGNLTIAQQEKRTLPQNANRQYSDTAYLFLKPSTATTGTFPSENIFEIASKKRSIVVYSWSEI